MKQLSFSQAYNCETANGKICRCRCNGLLHGAMRASEDELLTEKFYSQLVEFDPHHIDSKQQKLDKLIRQMEIANRLLKKEIRWYGPFKILEVIEDLVVICPFCTTIFKIPSTIIVNRTKFNYKTGWFHNCASSKLITTENSTYRSMLIRCYDTNHPSYINFGKLGIEVTQSWIDFFEEFLLDMKLKPKPDARLARIDRNSSYDISNCQWLIESEIDNGKLIVKEGKQIVMLHTMYKFNNEWYKFWVVEYDYGRPSKVLRTEEWQAPMTLLDGDFTFTVIKPASDELASKWLAKFGEKFGYQHARMIDDGTANYIEQMVVL